MLLSAGPGSFHVDMFVEVGSSSLSPEIVGTISFSTLAGLLRVTWPECCKKSRTKNQQTGFSLKSPNHWTRCRWLLCKTLSLCVSETGPFAGEVKIRTWSTKSLLSSFSLFYQENDESARKVKLKRHNKLQHQKLNVN